MQTLEITSETVLQHHLAAFGNNDLNELIKDYTEESEVWTPDGAIVGLKAISSFFSYAFTLFPKDKTKLEIKMCAPSEIFFISIAKASMLGLGVKLKCR